MENSVLTDSRGEPLNKVQNPVETLLTRLALAMENPRSKGLSPAMLRLVKDSCGAIRHMAEIIPILQSAVRETRVRLFALAHATGSLLIFPPNDERNTMIRDIFEKLPEGTEVIGFHNFDCVQDDVFHGVITERWTTDETTLITVRRFIDDQYQKFDTKKAVGLGKDQWVFVPVPRGVYRDSDADDQEKSAVDPITA